MISIFQHPLHGPVSLGKLPVTAERREVMRALAFEKYAATLPAPPQNCGWIDRVANNLNILGNDKYGNCVEAAGFHAIQRWTAYASTELVPTTAEALAAYTAVTGFNPNDPSTDNGTDPLQFLKYWKSHGLTIGGKLHKIAAFAAINPLNRTHIQQSAILLGGVFTGLQLPIAAQTPVAGVNGKPCWAYPGNTTGANNIPGSWGGHMVDLFGYGVDVKGNQGTGIDTWAIQYDMAYDFIGAYSDEMWAIVTEDFIEKDGKSPSGFDLKGLLADLKLVMA
jgi:hypothetical protein